MPELCAAAATALAKSASVKKEPSELSLALLWRLLLELPFMEDQDPSMESAVNGRKALSNRQEGGKLLTD